MSVKEILEALTGAYLYVRIGIFLPSCVLVTIIDIRSKRIPDILSIGSIIILFGLDLLFEKTRIPGAALSAFLALFCFLMIKLITRGIGLGDVKYAAAIAYFTGLELLPAVLFAAAVCGLAYALFAIKFLGKSAKDRIAFGPFLSIGALIPVINMVLYR